MSRVAGVGVVALGCLALANCSQTSSKLSSRVDPKYGVSASPRVIQPGQPVPKGGGTYRVGKPYVVGDRTYYPSENKRYRHEGVASWYGDDFHGRLTANGEIYDMESVSAAHPTLPMPSYARVTNLRNGRSLIVRVNDRGPFHANREIDLSGKAADLLGFRGKGLSRVRVEYVGPASLEGSDDRKLMATLREGSPAPAPSRVMLAAAKPFVPEPMPQVVRRPAPQPTLRRAIEEEPAVEREPEVAESPIPPPPPVRRMVAEVHPAPIEMRPLPPEVRRPPAGAGMAGRGGQPRLVWQTGPAPVRVSPVTAYAPEPEVVRPVGNGRGLY